MSKACVPLPKAEPPLRARENPAALRAKGLSTFPVSTSLQAELLGAVENQRPRSCGKSPFRAASDRESGRGVGRVELALDVNRHELDVGIDQQLPELTHFGHEQRGSADSLPEELDRSGKSTS